MDNKVGKIIKKYDRGNNDISGIIYSTLMDKSAIFADYLNEDADEQIIQEWKNIIRTPIKITNGIGPQLYTLQVGTPRANVFNVQMLSEFMKQKENKDMTNITGQDKTLITKYSELISIIKDKIKSLKTENEQIYILKSNNLVSDNRVEVICCKHVFLADPYVVRKFCNTLYEDNEKQIREIESDLYHLYEQGYSTANFDKLYNKYTK